MLAELHTGSPLFGGENEADQLHCIMEVLGLPPRNVLSRASRYKIFFDHCTFFGLFEFLVFGCDREGVSKGVGCLTVFLYLLICAQYMHREMHAVQQIYQHRRLPSNFNNSLCYPHCSLMFYLLVHTTHHTLPIRATKTNTSTKQNKTQHCSHRSPITNNTKF